MGKVPTSYIPCSVCNLNLIEVPLTTAYATCPDCRDTSPRKGESRLACQLCGEGFWVPSARTDKKFCSYSCLNSFFSNQKTHFTKDKVAESTTVSMCCLECKKMFATKPRGSATSTYCSSICRGRASNKRRIALLPKKQANCLACDKEFEAIKRPKKPYTMYCSRECSLSHKRDNTNKTLMKTCVHCGVECKVSANTRKNYVRCEKHTKMYNDEIKPLSAANRKKRVRAAEPFEDFILCGPIWTHNPPQWSVELLHRFNSNKKDMEYGKYLLSVKYGRRVGSNEVIVYHDGDISNVDLVNIDTLELAGSQRKTA